MKAKLKHLHAPGCDLSSYCPAEVDNFYLFLQAIVGPSGMDGEESFDIEVCSPKWIIENTAPTEVTVGHGKLILREYDINCIVTSIESYCAGLEADNWNQLAQKLRLLGHWEFEDYRE